MILRDLQAVMGPNLTGILLPKITGPADVHAADAILGCLETELGLPVGADDALPDPRERERDPQRVRDRDRVRARRVHGRRGVAVRRHRRATSASAGRATGTETLYIREKVLIDARAAGIRYPISGMWGGANDDLDGLRAWLTELRDIGYFGMMMGNAEHVPIVNAAFTPTAEEVAYWQRARPAHDAKPSAADERVIYGDANQGEGHEIHIAHVATARKLLAWARELGVDVTTRARPRSAPGSRTRSSTPTATSSSSRRCSNEEMLAYLEEMGGREVRDRYAQRHRRSPTRRPCSPAHAGARGAGLEGDAVVVGLADREHPRPRDRRTCPRCSTNGSTRSASTSRSCIRR